MPESERPPQNPRADAGDGGVSHIEGESAYLGRAVSSATRGALEWHAWLAGAYEGLLNRFT